MSTQFYIAIPPKIILKPKGFLMLSGGKAM